MPLIPGHSTKASRSSRQPSHRPRWSLVEDRCHLSPLTLPFSSPLQPGQAAELGRQGLSAPHKAQSSGPPWNMGFLSCRWGNEGQEWREQAPQSTSAGCVPTCLQNPAGHSFSRSLTYLHLPLSSPSSQLQIWGFPCSAKPGVIVTSFSSECPPHSSICRFCWFHLLNISQMLPAHHRHQPHPSLEMHLPPHEALCAHPGTPDHALWLTQPEEPQKTNQSFPPLLRVLPGSCLTQSKSQPVPKPTGSCVAWPWLPAALTPPSLPLLI